MARWVRSRWRTSIWTGARPPEPCKPSTGRSSCCSRSSGPDPTGASPRSPRSSAGTPRWPSGCSPPSRGAASWSPTRPPAATASVPPCCAWAGSGSAPVHWSCWPGRSWRSCAASPATPCCSVCRTASTCGAWRPRRARPGRCVTTRWSVSSTRRTPGLQPSRSTPTCRTSSATGSSGGARWPASPTGPSPILTCWSRSS